MRCMSIEESPNITEQGAEQGTLWRCTSSGGQEQSSLDR